jgi:hypothetical protein
MLRVHVIHWRSSEAVPLLRCLRAAAFEVSYCEDASASAVTKALRDHPPEAIVIDLSRLPSHGKEVAVWLRGRNATRQLPIVFVGGDPEKVARIQNVLPDAVYTNLESIGSALTSLPPTSPEKVVVPAQIMQRYGNRTAPQKMGIRSGMKAAIMNAPRDYLKVLGEIPEGVELIEDPDTVHDVTIWFVHEPDSFLAALPRLRRIAGQTKLWVLWRKGSANGMTQNFLRESLINTGLVDYKICSVDVHWSGIAFARRKQ